MGPASYDLVSFLLDRQPWPPSLAELRGHRLYFWKSDVCRVSGAIDPGRLCHEFRLMTIQRGLKATGTFSYQTASAAAALFTSSSSSQHFEIVLAGGRMAGTDFPPCNE